MIWLVALALLAQALPILSMSSLPFAWPEARVFWLIVVAVNTLLPLAVYALLIVGVVLLLTAEGNHVLVVIVCGVLMLAPCGNLLLLLLVNMSVTRTQRRAGLHVGLMGVKPEEVERILNPMLCKGCGYNLTGNVSGVCPECGRPITPPVVGAVEPFA